ncbi:putative phospholipase C, phosphatidylinositol-specific, Y domain, NAD(P)-binding domain superfamily [Helianthus anomalus]
MCKLFIKFVENRPFNDQRYFLDDEKLKSLGWSERTVWEEGLKKTIEWYTSNPNWWGDVSGAFLPHLRMLMMPDGIDRLVDGPKNVDFDSADVAINTSQIGVQIVSLNWRLVSPWLWLFTPVFVVGGTSMQRLVSMSSYTRPSYLRCLKRSLFDSHFLSFSAKTSQTRFFILFLYSNCLLVVLNEHIYITVLLMVTGAFLSKAINYLWFNNGFG